MKRLKTVNLKQHMVVGRLPSGEIQVAFILSTCGLTARQQFCDRFPDAAITQVNVVASSGLTKEDSESRDLWAEGRSWAEPPFRAGEETESCRRFFALKAAAERTTAVRRQLGITDWETATEEQLREAQEKLS